MDEHVSDGDADTAETTSSWRVILYTIGNSQSNSGRDSRGRNRDSIVDLVYGKGMDEGVSKLSCEYIGGTELESDAK
jgi:hypothetical protein